MIYWLVGIALVGYVAICALLYWRQEKLLFFPTKLADDFSYPFARPFTEVSLPVEGAIINAVHFTHPAPKGVLLYLHGNGDIIARLERVADYFLTLDYAVVIPDYRGYGKSSGSITTEQELHADMAAVYGYVQTLYPESQITLYGQSMGSGLAAKLAADNQPARLILESPYYSIRDMVAIRFPWLPRFLLTYQLRTDLWIGEIGCPVYLIHGTADPVIPYHASERLYGLIRGEKELLSVPGAGHNLLLGNAMVRAFLEKIL